MVDQRQSKIGHFRLIAYYNEQQIECTANNACYTTDSKQSAVYNTQKSLVDLEHHKATQQLFKTYTSKENSQKTPT